MNSLSKNCPKCRRFVANKICRADGRIDFCCPCNAFFRDGYLEEEDEANEFYGDWTNEEVMTLLKAIEISRSCDDDRRIFKGKMLYTTWRHGENFSKVKIYRDFWTLVTEI